MSFFCVFGQKNWKGWPDNFETFHKEKSGALEKTKILLRQPFMLKLGSKDLTNHKAALRVSQPMVARFYFLSETIHTQENGSRGTYLAKFLISNFLSLRA